MVRNISLRSPLYLLLMLLIIASCEDDSGTTPSPPPSGDELPRMNRSISKNQTEYIIDIEEISVYEQDSTNEFTLVDSMASGGAYSSSTDFESNWDEDFGFITFSSENPGSSPYPAVTFKYDVSSGKKGDGLPFVYSFEVTEIGVSLQDVLIGTAAELNARTYRYPYFEFVSGPTFNVREAGTNYIKGEIKAPVIKRIFDQGGFTGEVILANLTCTFTVCTGC